MGGPDRKDEQRRGMTFVLVLAFMLILAGAGAAFVVVSGSEIRQVLRQSDSTRAFYIAEGGAECAIAWLTRQPRPPKQTGQLNLGSLNRPQSLGDGTFTVTVIADVDNPTLALNRYTIRSIGIARESQRKVIVEVQVESFARYSYFTDDEHMRWQGWLIPVWFISGDYLEGPVHTNSHYHISGDPVFAGPVSSVDDFITYMHSGPPRDNPEFQQGIRLGVDEIDMPSKALEFRVKAVQDGLMLTGPTMVVLKSDGTMDVTNPHNRWVNKNMPLPSNGTLFVEGGDLTISGTLDGELTAGTNRNIIVADNILYEDDPRLNPDSNDVLGLVSEKDVIVSRSAPYNLEVDATVMALDDSFLVESWWEGLPRGTLTLYGGLIQHNRGPIGTFSSVSGRRLSGYSKDYHYDPRLLESPPPYYPTTGNYVVLSWREE